MTKRKVLQKISKTNRERIKLDKKGLNVNSHHVFC